MDNYFEILVNKTHPLNRDFIPPDMVEIHEPMGSKLNKNYVNMLNQTAYNAFKQMQAMALNEGFEIFIDSSYRSYAYQENVFNDVAKEKGLEHAQKYVALPGTSEHQTALSIDIIYQRNGIMLENQLDTDPEILWLMNNAHLFGFILRYPLGKEDITEYGYEPWHYRYVGRKLAYKLFTENLTLEEYYLQRKR